jgi:hypothetical protein
MANVESSSSISKLCSQLIVIIAVCRNYFINIKHP